MPDSSEPIAHPSEATADERAAQIEAFRVWLKDEIEHHPQSVHGIEVSAGIRGNALGKFLRGERGSRHSLTPLMIKRLAPVLATDEETLLARAGHLTHEPGAVSVERAISADGSLSLDDKRFLIELYRRAVRHG
jgi:hypothetical protein